MLEDWCFRVVRISETVFERWRLGVQGGEFPAMALRLRSRAVRPQALEAVEAAASDAIKRLWSDEPAVVGGDPPRTGRWSVMSVPGGVLLYIDEDPDDFEALVGMIAEGVEARGVSGVFELFEPTAVAAVPRSLPLIEARLRIVGKRDRRVPSAPMWWWKVDSEALWEVVSAAARWCAAYRGPLGMSSRIGLMPRVPVNPGEGLDVHLRGAIERPSNIGFDLVSSGVTGLRMVAVDPTWGRISLVEADTGLLGERWEPALSSARVFLAEHADRLVYGLVKHGSNLQRARSGGSLVWNWPPRREYRLPEYRAAPMEDLYAPDAFVLQLLGPGYSGRIPGGESWVATSAGDQASVILEHSNPREWFAFSLRGFSGAVNRSDPNYDAPAVLARAREDFAAADILIRDEYADPAYLESHAAQR